MNKKQHKELLIKLKKILGFLIDIKGSFIFCDNCGVAIKTGEEIQGEDKIVEKKRMPKTSLEVFKPVVDKVVKTPKYCLYCSENKIKKNK